MASNSVRAAEPAPLEVNEQPKKWTWCGIQSEDPAVRKKSRIIWSACAILTVAAILIFFLVIIPVIIQHNVDDSHLEVIQARIIHPNNQSFQSVVTQKFTHAGPVKAKAQMRDLGINWIYPEGGKIATLTGSSTFTVNNNHVVTMRSTAVVEDLDLLSKFNTYLTEQDTFNWKIKGKADITFIVKARVNVNKDVTLRGFGNFSVQPVVDYNNVTMGTPARLHLVAKVTQFSPSNVEIVFGQSLMYRVMSQGIEIGFGELPDYSIIPGTTSSLANLTLTADTPEQQAQIDMVLSNNSLGIPVNLTLNKFYNPHPVTWLAPSLLGIEQHVVIPPQTEKLTLTLIIYNQLIPIGIPYSLILNNPLDIEVTITHITGSVSYNDVTFATVDNPNLSIVIPPRSNVSTPQMTSNSVLTGALAFNELAAAGTGYTDLVNVLSVSFGDFDATLYYHQEDVYTIVIPYI